MRSPNRHFGIFATIVALLAMAFATRAQQAPPGPPPPDDQTVYQPAGPGAGPVDPNDPIALLGFQGDLGGNRVTGAPFSASFSTHTTRSLPDGNRIDRSTSGTIARDGEGRTRHELTLPAIGPWAASDKTPPHVILINDRVAGTQFILRPERKSAIELMQPPQGRLRRRLQAGGQGALQGRDVTTSSLGTKMIGGVSADGTLYTRTIPAGALGNEKPIVITFERWYSPDLQITVMTKRSDPRTGESVFELTNIQRQEPQASLFQVPSDYTVRQRNPRAGNALRRWRGQQGMRPDGGPGQPPPPPPQD